MMKKYMGFKLIEAEPMTNIEYFAKVKGITGDVIVEDGYYVKYPDGYESWSPKDVFEKAYMEVYPNPKLPSNVSVSQKMVDDFIDDVEIITMGDKTTVVKATCKNGFEITKTSSCVDPANYSQELGAQICMERIKDKLWGYLGFLLQTASHGIKGGK